MLQKPHKPSSGNGAEQEHAEAIEGIADHPWPGLSLGDTEDNGDEEGKDYGCAEMRQYEGGQGKAHYCFFPSAISWASTALIMLSRPATMMYLVP